MIEFLKGAWSWAKLIWAETWTRDNGGHLALWLIFAALIYFLPKIASTIIIPTMILFGREKLQWNCHIKDWDFRLGWPWQSPRWSLHKNMEWIAPSIGGVLAVAMTIVIFSI